MTKFEINQIDVNGDGRIILYQRPDVKNPKWQCRIRVAGATGYKRFSTKETDRRQAERIALDTYEELYFKVRRGGLLQSKTFKQVFEEWKSELSQAPSRHNDNTTRRIELVFIPRIGNKPIDEITENELSEIVISLIHLATATARKYRTSLNLLFAFSKRKGYVTSVPEIEAPALKRNPRPDFSLEEWKQLTQYMRKWVLAVPKGARGVNGLTDKKLFRERYYLQHYILILANTGIRIGEMRGVQWLHLDKIVIGDGEERVLIKVDGKTGPREVVANPGANTYFRRLWDFRNKELGEPPLKSEPIFCHPNGEHIGSYKKGFETLLNECGLRTDSRGRNRTLYSLRHTYATMRINEVPIYQLAVNMGTSTTMIEQYYAHARTKDPVFAQVVTKGNQRTSEKALPW